MNWKFLSVPFLGLAVVACDGKKEEKKTDEAAVKVEEPKATEEHKVAEEHKAAEVAPTETPKKEEKKDEKKEEKKNS